MQAGWAPLGPSVHHLWADLNADVPEDNAWGRHERLVRLASDGNRESPCPRLRDPLEH